jgi:outer membrane protease
MKRLTMIVVLSMFFLIGNNAESVWADGPYERLSSNPVTKRMGEEGFVFGNGILDVDFGLQFGSINGDTTYRISFDGGESELKFPLGAYLLGVNFGWGYRNEQKQEIVRMELKWLTNVSDGKGKMEDSDWIDDDASFLGIPGYNHSGLDIYSQSDLKLRAHIVNINVMYNVWLIKNFSIGPMAGYRYQFFKYDVKNTNQVGYGEYAPYFTASVRGNTLKYKITYHIPYIGLNSNLLLGKVFKTNLSLGYTPWAFANDRDDHLLRYKLSEGDTDGYAYIANLNVNLNFMTHLYLSIGGEYIRIHTTGTQDQSFYAGPYYGWTGEVDDKITSEYWSIYEMITYRF